MQQGQAAALDFDALLLSQSPSQFGTQSERNYIWYSLIGLGPNPAAPQRNAPYNPFDPVTLTTCAGGTNPGTGYQWLSKGTLGLRAPLCNTGAYAATLQTITADIQQQARQSCSMMLPEIPMGQTLDPYYLQIRYTPNGNGQAQTLTYELGAPACGRNNFYIEGDRIKLCPQPCMAVENDPNPMLQTVIVCYLEF